ncbi:inactive poly [ADP-ribose] polymerase RCD1-like isoform X2 [Impatiens glandulifera]|uniref:inactive poly [ADP-ribose] polymerase RCD1-like isoform X2 n=1 Tax=Impatiens glandulifera TaxID=253017 RepID=UPI001FB11ED8|nr:inactive poly [ADP-ribose] polymerase RCD1-like isoform X2 [Impatiens glandulifera]
MASLVKHALGRSGGIQLVEMETSDRESKTSMDLKRKRPAEGEAQFTGLKQMQSLQCNALDDFQRLIKSGKLNASVNKSGPSPRPVMKSLIHSYSNFMTSQVPQRMMYYQDGQWCDSPQDFISLIKKDFQLKRAATLIEFNGRQLFLDFIHMLQLDLKTGLQQSIAWMDESGQSFLPNSYEDNHLESPPNHDDIRLQLEIGINGFHSTKAQESNAMLPNRVNEVEVEVQVQVEATQMVGNLSEFIDSRSADPDTDTVRKMFITGMNNIKGIEIVDIYRGSSASMEARLELFHKQVEITKKNRGDANVHYAWLPSSNEMLSSTMMYGVGDTRKLRCQSKFGDCVHLIPLRGTIFSARASAVDINGARHMVFCRVIMGNMEVLHLESEQFHPSSDEYDTGVDNLLNPRLYMIWNMNKNTHIFPEYVVSFKVHSDTKGFPAGIVARPQLQMAPGCGGGFQGRDAYSKQNFLLLFAVIANKIPPASMVLVRESYDLLQKLNISRSEFIKRLRMIVGDPVLRSSIQSLPMMERK